MPRLVVEKEGFRTGRHYTKERAFNFVATNEVGFQGLLSHGWRFASWFRREPTVTMSSPKKRL